MQSIPRHKENPLVLTSAWTGDRSRKTGMPIDDAAQIMRLRRQLFDLHTVFEITRGFNEVLDSDALMEGILLGAISQLGVGAAAVAIPGNEQADVLDRWQAKGWDESTAADWVLRTDSPLAHALLAAGSPVSTNDLLPSLPSGDPKRLRLRSLRCVLMAPMSTRKRLRGILYLSGRLNGIPFADDDIRFLALLLDQVAVSLDNALLYEAERRTYVELLRTRERLAQAEKLSALGHLTAAIAHEVRNPLAIIRNHLELLGPAVAGSAADTETLRIMLAEVERIEWLVRNLLGAFRTGRGGTAMADAGTIIGDLAHVLAPQMARQHVQLVRDLPTSLPPAVADGESLRQVFLNLTMNALDAMPEGGKLTISAAHESDFLHLRFADEGAGIDPEVADCLFDPFTSTKSYGRGSGLGLAICRSIVDAYGGELSAENIPPPGHGAIFHVRLRHALTLEEVTTTAADIAGHTRYP